MRRVLLTLLLLVVVGAACGGGDDDSAAGDAGDDAGQGDGDDPGDSGSDGSYEVVVGVGNDLITLDPQAVQDNPGRVVYGNIFESLLTRAPDGEIVPLLAAALPVVVDPTTVDVTLQPGITFHDGSPLRAADVAYSINRVIDPDFRTQQATLFNTIAGAEAVDEQTVRIRTENPDPILSARLSLLLIVKENDADRADFAEAPVGTGPYMFVSRAPGSETVIEKWADYRTSLPDAPERLILRVVAEPRTRVAALERGEIDIVPTLSPDDVELAPRAEAVTGTETMLLRLNSRGGTLVDQRLREAVNLAIDRQEIVDALFSGYAEPSTCQIAAPSVFGHDDSIDVPEYDPERAKEVVEEAAPDGASLSMSASASRFAKGREVSQAIEQYLEDAGFDVELDFPSDQVAAQQLLQEPQFPSIFMYSANSEFFDEAKELQWLTTDGQFSGADNPAVDTLADQVQQETDPATREQLFSQINQQSCDDVANVYLYVAQDIYGLSDDVEWTPRADGLVFAAEMSAGG